MAKENNNDDIMEWFRSREEASDLRNHLMSNAGSGISDEQGITESVSNETVSSEGGSGLFLDSEEAKPPVPVSQIIYADDAEGTKCALKLSQTLIQNAEESNPPVPPGHEIHEHAPKRTKTKDEKEAMCMPTIIDDVPPIPASQSIDAVANNKNGPVLKFKSGPVTTNNVQETRQDFCSAFPEESGITPRSDIHLVRQSEPPESHIVVPEAFLVMEDLNGIDIPSAAIAEIPSAQVVVPDKYSMTIGGRKLHGGVMALLILVLISVVAGVSVYVTLQSRNPTNSTEVANTTLTEDSINSTKLESKQPTNITESENTTQIDKDFINFTELVDKQIQMRNKTAIRNEIEINVLCRNITFSELPSSDIRVEALNWILHNDTRKLSESDSNLYQRYILALLGVQHNLDEDSDWMSDTHECDWYGISCLDDVVLGLEPGGVKLTGTIPPEISGLRFLKYVTLNGNDLSGTLPPEICSMEDLKTVRLDENQFTGSLPSSLGNLNKLTSFDISMNQFTGSLPASVGNLTELKYLLIDGNQFTSSLPSSIGQMTSLTRFLLHYNQFTGTIPPSLGNLKNLVTFDIGVNHFTGNIPPSIGNLKQLTELKAHGNQFTDCLPSSIGNLTALIYLQVSSNQCTGHLPFSIGNLNKLAELYIYDNHFTGRLPGSIGYLTSLTHFGISQNQFTGSLPTSIGMFTELTELNLQDNAFSGTLPTEIGFLTHLTQILIGNNGFTGTLPTEIGYLTELTTLSIRDNNFSNDLPSELGNLPELGAVET